MLEERIAILVSDFLGELEAFFGPLGNRWVSREVLGKVVTFQTLAKTVRGCGNELVDLALSLGWAVHAARRVSEKVVPVSMQIPASVQHADRDRIAPTIPLREHG